MSEVTRKRICATTRWRDSNDIENKRSPIDVEITVRINSSIIDALSDIEFTYIQDGVMAVAVQTEQLILRALLKSLRSE